MTLVQLWSSFSSILNRSGANTIQNTSQLSSMDFPSNLQCIPSKCIYTWSSTFTEHKSFHSSMVWAKSTMQRGTLKKQKKKKESGMKSRKRWQVIDPYLDFTNLVMLGESVIIKDCEYQRLVKSFAIRYLKIQENTSWRWHIT